MSVIELSYEKSLKTVKQEACSVRTPQYSIRLTAIAA